MSRFWNSFRARLFILVILGVVPALGIVLHSAREQRRVAAEYAQESALRLATDVSKDQHLMIEMTRRMLADLATDPAIKSLDIPACSQIFKTSFRGRPFLFYANIAVIDLQGNLVCSAIPLSGPVNVADRHYFQQAVRTGSFSVGSFQISRVSGAKTINFGYPAKGENGQICAVVTAALDLSWFNELAAAANLPKDASLTIIDGDGTVLSRYPDPGKWVGRAAPESDVIKTVLAHREGVAEAVGIDGIPKLYGFRPLGSLPQGGFVYVGLPKEPVFAKANQMLSSNLIIVGLAAVLGLLAVWAFGYVFVMRGVNGLVSAARQLATGNLNARSGLGPINGEIGQLATVFDEMADSLQKREAEQQLARERLRSERNFSDMLIESLPGIFMLFDRKGMFLRWNRNLEKASGYAAEELLHRDPSDFFQGDDKHSIKNAFRRVMQEGEAAISAALVSKDGTKTPYLFTGKLVTLNGNRNVICTGLDMADRNRLEKERNRLFNLSLDLLSIGGFDGLLKQVNPAWNRTFGWNDEELLSRPFVEFIHPEDREATFEAARQMIAGHAVYSLENRCQCKDGSYRWISWNSFPLAEERLVFAVARDITERKLSEQKLREAQALLLAAIEQTPAGILIANAPDVRIQLANSAAVAIRGDTDEPLTGISYDLHPHNWQMLRPDGIPFKPEDLPLSQAVLHGLVSRNVDAIIRNSSGEDRWILANAAPVRNETGEITAGVLVFPDITELKKAEGELRQSEDKYRRILETIADGYHEVDLVGNLTLVNDSLCEIIGYSREELLGMNYRQVMDEDNAKRISEACNRVFRTGEAHPGFDYEILRKDGTKRSVSVSISLIRDSGGVPSGFRGIFRDVTDSKRMEGQLRQAAKMEAIGRLAGGVAHDFNNILTAVMGYSTILSEQLPKESPAQEKLNQIGRAAGRAADLTRQLLAFSRKQMLDVRVVNLNEIITDLEKMLQRLIGEDIELTTNLNPSAGHVKADPIQIEQILMNLAVNARDAMPEGGNLAIETADAFLDEDYARAHIEVEPGPYVVFTVSDTGRGMDSAILKCIFDPFFTTKEKGVGTGLGLSTVYGIVKQHRGHITVYSEPGRGSTFRIYLPRVDDDLRQEAKTLSTQSRPCGKETVLVVEDEEMVRNIACEALEMLGYSTLSAADPYEAEVISSRHKGPIHLLLTDVVLPQMDGRSLHRSLAPSRPDMKVLFVSGYTESFIIHRGVLDSGVHFMQKPFTVESLARKVREVLDET